MSKIEILSQVAAPDTVKRAVKVLYRTGGKKVSAEFQVGCPTYFDEIIVTKSRLERQQPPAYPITGGFLKQLAKSALQKGQRAASTRLPPSEIEGPILDMRMLEPNNIAHLLMCILPFCLSAQKVLQERITILFRPMREPFLTLVSKFGVTPTFTDRAVSGEFLRFLGSRGLAVYDLTSVFDVDAISFFPETYDGYTYPPPDMAGAEKLFVARTGARALLNHKQVENFLTARGYTTVYFENHSVEQQLALGAHAKSIVSIHGAALAYFVLGSKLRSVVELLPPHVYHQLFPVELPRSIADYSLIVPDFDTDIAYGGWSAIVQWKNRPFEADMELLEEAVAGAKSPSG